MTPVKTNLDFTEGRVLGLPAPTQSGEAANKDYVDSIVVSRTDHYTKHIMQGVL